MAPLSSKSNSYSNSKAYSSTTAMAAASNVLNSANTSTASLTKAQKYFDQLRRIILGRDPSLDEIKKLVRDHPSCVQQSDTQHGLLALHWCCVFQTPLAIIQFLTECYPDAVAIPDAEGRTPLHHSCRPEGRVEIVDYLLEHNTRVVTQRDNRGKTPLHCATAEFVDTAIVKALIDANPASVKIRTRDGQTPLFCACEFNAPLSTIRVLVDAYPEAVKYIRNTHGEKFQQAKDYLAYKVQQTEEEAEAIRTSSSKQHDEQQQQQLYNTQDSDEMRRLLDEEEQRIEYEDNLNRRANQEKEAALQRLRQEEDDVEQKAAELDRLIQQKEAHIETERFQTKTQRLFHHQSGDKQQQQQQHQEDSDFLSDRPQSRVSESGYISDSDRPPSSKHYKSSSNRIDTSEDDEEDEELFGSLRNSGKTQSLYPESQVKTSDTWNIPTTVSTSRSKPKHSRDPSTGSRQRLIDAPPERDMLPSRTGMSTPQKATPNNKVPSLQQQESPQLAQALKLLEQAELRRQKEMEEAKLLQAKQQAELNKLMDQLVEAEQQRQKEYADAEERGRKQAEHDKLQQTARQVLQQEPPPVGTSFLDHQSGASRVGNTPSVASSHIEQRQQKQQQQQQAPQQDEMRDAAGCTPLHLACANGISYTTAQLLMQQFPLAVYQTCLKGNTPLHYACSYSTSLEVLQLLLDVFPAAVLMSNEQLQCPIHLACIHNADRFEVLQLLLETSRRLEQEIANAGGQKDKAPYEKTSETEG